MNRETPICSRLGATRSVLLLSGVWWPVQSWTQSSLDRATRMLRMCMGFPRHMQEAKLLIKLAK